jgi:hypothetical protein
VGGRVPRSVLLPGSISNQVLPAPNGRGPRRRRFGGGVDAPLVAFILGDALALSSGDTSNRADVRDVAECRSPVTPTTAAAGFFSPTAGTPAGAG